MKKSIIFLIAFIFTSISFGQVSEQLFLKIEKLDVNRMRFYACQVQRLSACALVGRNQGYTTEELTNLKNELRFNKHLSDAKATGALAAAIGFGALGGLESVMIFQSLKLAIVSSKIGATVGGLVGGRYAAEFINERVELQEYQDAVNTLIANKTLTGVDIIAFEAALKFL